MRKTTSVTQYCPRFNVGIIHEKDLPNENILPEQFWPGRTYPTPEEQLVSTLIEDAVGDYQKHRAATTNFGRKIFKDASDWIFSDEDHPFSFKWACDVFKIDPQAVREKLQKQNSVFTPPA